MTHQIRPYQRTAIDRVRAAWQRGDLGGGLVLPTGTGKTFTAVQILRESMLADGRVHGRALWLAHRKELLDQPLAALRRHFPEASLGLVKASTRQWRADVVVASVQSLQAHRLPEVQAFDYVVVDEAHHAVLDLRKDEEGKVEVAGNTYGRLLTHLRRLNPQMGLVGLTATPFRGDRKGLGGCFPGRYGDDGLPADDVGVGLCYFAYGIWDAIRDGYLSPFYTDAAGNPSSVLVDTGTSLAGVHTRQGDFVVSELAEAVNTRARNDMVVDAWMQNARGRPTLAFCVDVGPLEGKAADPEAGLEEVVPFSGHVFSLRDAFRRHGVTCEAVYGAMPGDERERVLAAYQRGEVEVVTNCGVLTEGFDAPLTSCVIMARPTKSRGLYQQMVGRGTRLAPGKSDLMVLDCADVTPSTGDPLATLADLVVDRPIDPETGLPVEEVEEVVDGRPVSREEAPRTEDGHIDWRRVLRPFWPDDNPIHWGEVGTTRYLGLGDQRAVLVYEEDGAWRSCLVNTLDRTLEYLTCPFGAVDDYAGAMAAAEYMVRRSGAHGRYRRYYEAGQWASREDIGRRDRHWLRQFGFEDDVVEGWSRSDGALAIGWCFAVEVVLEEQLGRRVTPMDRRRLAGIYMRRVFGDRRRAA